MSKIQFKVSRRIYENVWFYKKLTSKQKAVVWHFRKRGLRPSLLKTTLRSPKTASTILFPKGVISTSKSSTGVLPPAIKTNKRTSDFATQLQNKTKFAIFYGNFAKRRRLIVPKKLPVVFFNKQKSILFRLETRLDVLLVRANFCNTIFTARQLITHSKICVNSKIVTFPGLQLQIGDIIGVPQNQLTKLQSIIAAQQQQNLVNNKAGSVMLHKAYHLEINYKTLNIVFLYEPCKIVFPYHIDLDLI